MKADASATVSTDERERLFADFAIPTREAWRAAAEAQLKGEPFEKRLVTRTPEGIDLQPIYHREDIAGLAHLRDLPGCGSRVRGARAAGHAVDPWRISQELSAATPEAFNALARRELAEGQTELNVLLDGATRAGRDPDVAAAGEVGTGGVSLATVEDVERALAGIDLSTTPVFLRAGASALPVAALLLAWARRRQVPAAELRGCLGSDPLGVLAATGELPTSLAQAYDEMAALTRFAVRHARQLQTIAVETHAYHDGGATAVEELAFALATGLEYLRALQVRGLPVDEAAPRVRVALSIGSNLFMEIAKCRAARLLWAQVVRVLGGGAAAQSLHLHARTSTYNKTVCDPHVNILRGTSEAFAAVVGGCDSLHVGPFDEVAPVPGELPRRVARNTQIILAEECDLARVIDPAGGSCFVEWLTDQLARRAWGLFQEIEGQGGMARALAAGSPQARIAASARFRSEAVARRRAVIVGTNQYANARETPGARREEPDATGLREARARQLADFRARFAVARRAAGGNGLALRFDHPASDGVLAAAADAASHGATLGEICRALRAHAGPAGSVSPVPRERAAEPFERLRAAALRFRERTGRSPLIFQANLGPTRGYRMRADWTTGFFEVGGFEVLADAEFESVEAAAQAAIASGARAVVITSRDDRYPDVVAPLARALKARDPGVCVLVAGTPREHETAWRAAGVDAFVNTSSHALDLLTQLLTRLEVLP